MTTINMQTMRYINLLDKVSRVKTMTCFVYNNTIFFAVQKNKLTKAIGPKASNVKKIQEDLGKKIKIISEPKSKEKKDVELFIQNIVDPVKFKEIEIKDGELILNAGGNQNKAILIGRHKKRLEELSKIVEDLFGKNLKII